MFSSLAALFLLVASMAACAETPKTATGLEALSELRWRNRLILVANTEGSKEVIKTLQKNKAELDERDTVWIVIDEPSAHSNLLLALTLPVMEEVATILGESNVVLLGKDGGVKARASNLDLEKLYGLIDSMPMRRQEMSLSREGRRL
ncbi:MAG: DUF4174 domain-containing protein [Pseudomonadota bacterium]